MKTMMIVVAICCCLIAGCGDGSEKFVRASKSLPCGECRGYVSTVETVADALLLTSLIWII